MIWSRCLRLMCAATVFGSVLATLSLSAQPRPLFDGKTLQGWEGDLHWWRVTDGAISGGSLTEKVPKNVFLATTESFQNFDLRLKIRIRGTEGFINSGIQIRSVRVPNSTEMAGYQVDAGDGWWGKLYDESRRKKVIADSAQSAAVVASIKKDDWNDYRILAQGPRIQTWINGVPALDYHEAEQNIAQDGHIGLQVHSGGKALIEFKDLTIEPLPAAADAPTWDKVGRPGEKKVGGLDPRAPQPRTATDQLRSFRIADGLEIELVASEDTTQGIGKFISVTFDQKGRMWSSTAREYPVDGNESPEVARALYAGNGRDHVIIFDSPFSPGPQTARSFADGLAIPLGVLPYLDGCYVQHGPDVVLLRDTDGDGRADQRTSILTGFGVEDSHLMPHQFTRAPGNWIWLAQGAFNRSQVRRPQDPPEKAIAFDQTRMARFRPNGDQFEITAQGPCNIWGLVISGEGEAFIQEANDYGYPVMPFHEFANYPGCSNRQFKSYAPDFPATAEFRLGGTGLSGLALTDPNGIFPEPWADVMLVANPITRKINAIKLHRSGPRWWLEQLPDLLSSDDEMFRPIALTLGPDGCVYVTDWYNRIISHNEVARNHPERDKERGRIWRIKPRQRAPLVVPDFTTLPPADLLAIFGGPSVTQAHLAWQAITDRKLTQDPAFASALHTIVRDPQQSAPRRIQTLWALTGSGAAGYESPQTLLNADNRNLRREAVRASDALNGWTLSDFVSAYASRTQEPDPEVRAEIIRQLGRHLSTAAPTSAAFHLLLSFALPPLEGPTTDPTWRPGAKIKVAEAYEREFERYLVRSVLEQHRAFTERLLSSPEGRSFPVEARMLAALSLEPGEGAPRVAQELLLLSRPPETEELFRVAQFAQTPAHAEALSTLLARENRRTQVLERLLVNRTQLNPASLQAVLTPYAQSLLRSAKSEDLDLGLRLSSGFKLIGAESDLARLLQSNTGLATAPGEDRQIAALKALSEIGARDLSTFETTLTTTSSPRVRYEAAVALAQSRQPGAENRVLALWPHLSTAQRKAALDRLLTRKEGATAVVAGLTRAELSLEDLDSTRIERLQALLPSDAAVTALAQKLQTDARLILAMDGTEAAQSELGITLRGPFTLETWIRLEPGDRAVGLTDGLFGCPGNMDMHFAENRLHIRFFTPDRVFLVSKRQIPAEVWTHLAITRESNGIWSIYIDGQHDAQSETPDQRPLEAIRLGWNLPPDGPRALFSDVRAWSVARSATDLAATFDRRLPSAVTGLLLQTNDEQSWGKRRQGATLIKTSQTPPVISAEAAAALDAKFTRLRLLAEKDGNASRGRELAATCLACHVIGKEGGAIGPNLSGAGAMGVEGLLRSLVTPNAAMESAYQIFRVEMKDGAIFEGFLAQESPEVIILRTPGSEDQRISRDKVRNAHFVRRSLMPEGLLDGLAPEQVTDLFAYLKTLR
ncbi:MAG TPA: DUF1080 domain-containing protein [Opitutaceae bacterium]|nr:DUF1080 domain-containing protein [Opitutaceae bacterium]